MPNQEQPQTIIPSLNNVADDEIDLRELISAIWQGKWLIVAVTFVFAVGGVIYAKSLPDIYMSEALLAPASESSGMKVSGQLSGLAALAGVNLGGSGGDKTSLAIEVIKSREFIGQFIEKYDLFVPVMAAESWTRHDDSLQIDNEAYNTETKKWVRDVKPPYESKPSIFETYESFMELLNVSQDKETGMIKLSIEHFSPYLAKKWVDLIIKEINKEMRERELDEAQSSINYLNGQISQTNIADVRSMLFSLIEEQTKTVMLASVRDEYVFKTIDSAIVAEKKSKPKRALIVVLSVMLGGMLSIIVVLGRYFSRNS
ncbi:MAG: Wzz/FepE/Etk N-terminal domain-containing protein [Oleiphilus sp.]